MVCHHFSTATALRKRGVARASKNDTKLSCFQISFLFIHCSLGWCNHLTVFQISDKVDPDSFCFFLTFLWEDKSLELPTLSFCWCYSLFHFWKIVLLDLKFLVDRFFFFQPFESIFLLFWPTLFPVRNKVLLLLRLPCTWWVIFLLLLFRFSLCLWISKFLL